MVYLSIAGNGWVIRLFVLCREQCINMMSVVGLHAKDVSEGWFIAQIHVECHHAIIGNAYLLAVVEQQ